MKFLNYSSILFFPIQFHFFLYVCNFFLLVYNIYILIRVIPIVEFQTAKCKKIFLYIPVSNWNCSKIWFLKKNLLLVFKFQKFTKRYYSIILSAESWILFLSWTTIPNLWFTTIEMLFHFVWLWDKKYQ